MSDLDTQRLAGVEVDVRPAHSARAFVVTMAMCIASAAISIDLMLPAFPDIRDDFGLARDSTAVVWTLTAFLLGMGIGQLFYGPVSDRFGRKPLMYLGLAVYFVGAAAAALAPNLALLIAARALWGIGVAGPRSIAMAMVRDRFTGTEMARTMSYVMATFIIIPIVGPSIGAVLISFAPWQIVFWIPAAFALALMVAVTRLPETLPPHARRSIAPHALAAAFRIVVTNRRVAAFAFALTCFFGVLTGMIGNIEIIFDDVYDQGDLFPIAFAAVGIGAGIGQLGNARIVERLGLRRTLRIGMIYAITMGTILSAVALASGGDPPLWMFWILLALLFPSVMVLISNSQAAAMAPVPQVAGMAAAFLGALSTGGGAMLGNLTAAAFDGTVRPFAWLTLLFVVLGAGGVVVGSWPRRA